MKKQEKETNQNIFSYQFFQSNRYKISQNQPYEAICNNGFIKLYTLPGRVYWHAQNQFGHRVPDWKFHISVCHDDLKKAWNLMVNLFIKLKCRGGMKAIYLKQAQNPAKGRQITLYIVKIPKQFKKSTFAGQFGVSISDQHSEQYWINFVKEIQITLKRQNIRCNGLAKGDLKIKNAEYVSLRNEAFIIRKTNKKRQTFQQVNINEEYNYIYPPDEDGWNPLRQEVPINIKKMQRELKNLQQQQQQQNQMNEKDEQKMQMIKKWSIYGVTGIILICLSFWSVKVSHLK